MRASSRPPISSTLSPRANSSGVGRELAGRDHEAGLRIDASHRAVEPPGRVGADLTGAPVPAVDEVGAVILDEDHVVRLGADRGNVKALDAKRLGQEQLQIAPFHRADLEHRVEVAAARLVAQDRPQNGSGCVTQPCESGFHARHGTSWCPTPRDKGMN
jgi:hypothetical protein